MICPVCSGDTTVFDTFTEVDVVYRKRRCKECGNTFFTEEVDSRNQDEVRKEMNRIKRGKYDRTKKQDVV